MQTDGNIVQRHCVRGDRVDDLYDRETAEKAEIDLLKKVAADGFESFSLVWRLVDRQWQIIAFAEKPSVGPKSIKAPTAIPIMQASSG